MLVELSILCATISFILASFVDYKDKSIFLFLWVLLFLFSFFPLFLFGEEHYNENVLFESFLFMACCNIAYTVVVLFFKGEWRKTRYIYNLEYKAALNRYFFLIILIVFLIVIFNKLSLQVILASDLSHKRSLGISYLVLLYLLAALTPFLVYYIENKKLLFVVLTVFIFVFFLLYFRSRSLLSFVVIPIGYYFLFYKKYQFRTLILFASIAWVIAQSVKVIRYQGALSNGLSLDTIMENITDVFSSSFNKGTGDFSIGFVFSDIVRDCDTAYWCSNYTLINKLFSKVFYYQNEVKTVEYHLWDYYFESGVNGSLHPTGYGFAFADFSFLGGVLFFGVIGAIRCLFTFTQNKLQGNILLFGFVAYFLVFFARGSVYNSLVFMLLPITLLSLVYFSKKVIK